MLNEQPQTAASPLFVLGAGFGYDVKAVVGPNEIHGTVIDGLGYPLASELWGICFPGERPRRDASVEARFHEAMRGRDDRPMEALSDRLMKSDYYLARWIQRTQNCYTDFLKKFSESSFLTFNYDSLVEILLFRLKRWFPADGFGVPVNVRAWPKGASARKSKQWVVHLHGTMCVFAEEAERVRGMVELREQPLFYFDPGLITDCFLPFARVHRPGGHDPPHDRVIAPIPHKAEGRARPFIDRAYQCAEHLIAGTELLVAVGYSFSKHDRSSYDRLVRALGHAIDPKVVVVAPDAQDICRRLGNEHARVAWTPVAKAFREWADDGFHTGLGTGESSAQRGHAPHRRKKGGGG